MSIRIYKKKAQTRGPHLMSILEDICLFYGKSSHEVISKTTDKNGRYVVIRRLYCYVAWKITNAPLKDIGAIIDKGHDNVIFHRDTVDNWIKKGRTHWIDEWLDWLKWTTLWGQYEKIRD